MDYTLAALNLDALSLGRAVVMYAPEWDGTGDLTLTHLGDTQGNIVFNSNERINGLRLPERFGDAFLRAYVRGADPVLTVPIILADPTLRDLISPTGDGVIGTDARTEVTRYTLVVFPEALFFNANTRENDAKLQYTTAGGWLKSAEDSGDPDNFVALTTDEQRLLGLSIWIWSGYWERPPFTYEATIEDEVVNVEEATFHGMRSDTVFAMVTIGSPADHGIVIDVT